MDNIFSKFEECPGQDEDGYCSIERDGWLCRDMAEFLVGDVANDTAMPEEWSRAQIAVFIDANNMWTEPIWRIVRRIREEVAADIAAMQAG